MGDYGFKLISLEEAKAMGFPSGSGLFEDLFRQMTKETNRTQYGEAQNMSREEKEISFLNRYFIFRKTHDVKADKVSKVTGQIEDKEAFEEVVKETMKKPTMFIQKLKRKVRLHRYEEVDELGSVQDIIEKYK